MRFLKALFFLAFTVLVFVVAVAFIAANDQLVAVEFLVVPSIESISVGKLIIAVFIAGGISGLLAASLVIARQSRDKARLERRIKNSARLMSGMGS